MRNLKVSLPVLLITCLSSLSYSATPDRITGAVNNGQTVALPHNVHYRALPEYDRGPVDPALRLGYITLLTVPSVSQQKALKQLVADQQNPNSPSYHKWLTPERYADRFGLSHGDVQKITAWLKSKGFQIEYVARGRNWVAFSGTAAQVQSALGTEIHSYDVDGESHYANATAPAIPAALAGVVSGFGGLHDFRPRPLGVRRAHPDYNSTNYGDLAAPGDIATVYDINALYTAGIDGTGQKLVVAGQTDIYLEDINDFRSGFSLSSITGCTVDSTTDLITSCDASNFQYVLVGTDPKKPSAGDLAESDLDLEWAGAIARNAQIIFVNGQTAGGAFDAYYNAIDNNLAPVISLSYGVCELGDAGAITADEAELTKGNSFGITIVNSSGDTGVADCDPNNSTIAVQGLSVGYPASSPEVTGVGGSAIPLADINNGANAGTYWGTTGSNGGTAKSYIPEQGWNDVDEIFQFCQQNSGNLFCTQGGNPAVSGWVSITTPMAAQTDIAISSSGGGASNCSTTNGSGVCTGGFPQPAWQTVTVSGQASARFSPDVSLLASPFYPGYIVCTQLSELGITGTGSSCASGISNSVENNGSVFGGTSVSAPVFAGIVTLLNQYLAGPASPGLGNVNPTLYKLAGTPANGAFHPVKTGDNTVFCTPGTPSAQPVALRCPSGGSFGYLASNADATTGFNLVTGLGSVDANALAVAWDATRTPTTTSLSSSTAQTYQSGSVTLTATIVPSSAAGSVTFTNGSTALGTAAFSGGGTAALTTTALPVGPNSITATYSGNGVLKGSTSSATTVTVMPAFALTLTTASFNVAQGSAVDVPVTLALTNGFSGTVTFTCSDLASESVCTPPPATNASSNVSFHVTTTAATASLRRPGDSGSRFFYAMLLPGLFGILLTTGSRKRSLRGMRMQGLILILGISTLWLGSCGGSSNSSQGNPGTPKGSYTIAVTGTSGAATSSAKFTIVVQ